MWWIVGLPSILAIILCVYLTFLYTQTNCTYDELFWWVPECFCLRWILGEQERYRPYKTRGWLLQKWDYVYYKFIEPVLHVLAVGFFFICTPALVVFVFLYLFYCCWQAAWNFLKTKAMLPILFGVFGLFFGIFGWQGALAGAVSGFVLGLLIEICKVNDVDHTVTKEPYRTGFQSTTVETKPTTCYTGYTTYYHERPWIWKGWQVESGPKEDSLRKDL